MRIKVNPNNFSFALNKDFSVDNVNSLPIVIWLNNNLGYCHSYSRWKVAGLKWSLVDRAPYTGVDETVLRFDGRIMRGKLRTEFILRFCSV